MVTYRLANESDYEDINNFHNRIYQHNRSIDAFCWEFQNGPNGASIYVVAVDDGKIIGTNCVIPIDLIDNDGNIIRSGKSEDTLVDPDYRGQGIFYKIYEFLFEACRNEGVQVIWGFTSALKPFGKMGFDVPFSHEQSLCVNNVSAAYKYFSNLNPKNRIVEKTKILGLVTYAKLRNVMTRNRKLPDGYTIREDIELLDGVHDLVASHFQANPGMFAIYQKETYQQWRVYKNPNYYKVLTYGCYNRSDELKGVIVLNTYPDGLAFVNYSIFSADMDEEDAAKLLRNVTQRSFTKGAYLIRDWHFSTTATNKQLIRIFEAAGHTHLKRGVGFVWKILDDSVIDPKSFYLSRIATQGVI